MQNLHLYLENCFGIQELTHTFKFDGNASSKAYAIYAPNGLMKTSFTKTFDALSRNDSPKEERFNRPTKCVVEVDGQPIRSQSIYVVKAEIDIQHESPAITNLLVDPERKARYDSLLVKLEERKKNLINGLQKSSRVKANDVEQTLLNCWREDDFVSCLEAMVAEPITDDLSNFPYETIFNSKALAVIDSKEFEKRATEFRLRYDSLFDQSGSVYKKGVFNPTKAEASLDSLKRQGFFAGGHKVHLDGDQSSLDQRSFEKKLEELNSKINQDEELRSLQTKLAKNAQAQALVDLIETLPATKVDFLLENLKPEKRPTFQKKLWAFYAQELSESKSYLDDYSTSKQEIFRIEHEASKEIPHWETAVALFNQRFIDMPFTLELADQSQVVLGKKNAELRFVFEDGADQVEWKRSEIKTLSQGEMRALYLLNFIFEVEARKRNGQETLFVIDDIADSFDYKNKHAIIQYLSDLNKIEFFHQIILTHNFDFFRTLTRFVPRKRTLMANRLTSRITLEEAQGVSNPFVNMWKDKVAETDTILCATIPFTRNLIEYTRDTKDVDYLKLTSMLHWKSDSKKLTVGEYFSVFNDLFKTSHDTSRIDGIIEVLFRQAEEICRATEEKGLTLSEKIVLSIAIRIKAEIFMLKEIRRISGTPKFWYTGSNQYAALAKRFSNLMPSLSAQSTIEKVNITVSSNIHLNSFMYEPILDLSLSHLVTLYREVKRLY